MNPPLLRILCISLCSLLSVTAMAQEVPTLPDSIPTIPKNDEPVRTPADEDDKGIFSFVFENDIVAGTDHGYTNGVRFSWLSSEKNNPEWLNNAADFLPIDGSGNKRVSVALGQSMFTPDDQQLNPPDPNDRPYAGWLYGSLGVVSDTGKTLDNVLLTVGVVGPASGAKGTQNFVHDLIDDDRARGWGSQLHNEPGLMLTYERKWRNLYQAEAFGLGADVVPHVGANLGNINTSAAVGSTFRIGYDLPADYGPPRIRPSLPGSDFFIPSKDLSYYLFTTVEGRAVARDIFLDGNTFEDSPSVDKKNLVGSLQVGAAVTWGDTRISYTQVFMTKQYKTESQPTQFGSLAVSYRF